MIELNFIYVLATAFIVVSFSHLELSSDAVPLQSHPSGVHIQDLRKQPDLYAAASNQNSNVVQKNTTLDKAKEKKRVHVHPALTTKFMEFVAQAQMREGEETDEPPDGASDNGVDDSTDAGAAGGGGGAGGSGTGGNGTDTGGTKGHEITISVPKFHKDHMGNWIYHVWGATYGNLWGDTRFNNAQFTIPRIRVDSNASINYYPDGPRSTVCMGSTIYNVPAVQNWLRRNVYTEVHKHPTLLDPLRQQIYKEGRSEECHDPEKYSKWKDYQECAMRRNQRMEYYIPKYPLHQIGFKGSKEGAKHA
ncbi:uncharacterized protein LOC132790473 isoform X1 [Drosophila nasuta]|uniref:uncharacterized protein LOC132790473 isoform X1 n=1 Tax=Drosophila nasuta TaxID=42062 RepID=UPI00295EDE21|nr:uncharacterized protein LOC132790473 isoform X1 [Drosophila nasuta]